MVHGARLRRSARTCVLAVLGVGAALAPSAAAASTHPHVGPGQHFTASINGLTGDQGPVTIRMACYGPIQPGQTGHPLQGQTVAVRLAGTPAGGTSALGSTGSRSTSIGAFFGPPPPSATPVNSSYVNFSSYRTKPIPTSLVLPCAGTGQVTFVPLPVDPTSHSIAVPVAFVGQP